MDSNPIKNFYFNKEVFITGASGLIGKALTEKLLRSCPGVKKIYLLLRNKKGLTATERLEKLKKSQIFDKIRESGCEDILNKLVAINGDITKIQLGLSEKDLDLIKNVSIIFHNAATVRFDEPLKDAIIQNIRGTREVLLIAEKLKNFEKFVHCSTAYSNCYLNCIEEKVYPLFSDWEFYIKLAEKYDNLDYFTNKILDKFPNTYTFSKHVAENLVNSFSHRVPSVIFRPSIVVNALREPFEGWFDGITGAVALITGILSGVLQVTQLHSEKILDFMPLDIVVIAQIITGWKETNPKDQKEQVKVINCSSTKWFSYSIKEILTEIIELYEETPFEKFLWKPNLLFIENQPKVHYILFLLYHIIPGIFVDTMLKITGNQPFLLKTYRKAYSSLELLSHFYRSMFSFEVDRFGEILEETKDMEDFSMAFALKLTKKEQIGTILYGTRKFLLKNSDDSIEKSKFRFKIVKWIDKVFRYCFIFWIFKKFINLVQSGILYDVIGV